MTSLNAEELEEGDCRYLPKEILSDDHSHLTKADVFALGLIIFQAVSIIRPFLYIVNVCTINPVVGKSTNPSYFKPIMTVFAS